MSLQCNSDINYLELLQPARAKGTVFQNFPYFRHQPYTQGFLSFSPTDQQAINSGVSTTLSGWIIL